MVPIEGYQHLAVAIDEVVAGHWPGARCNRVGGAHRLKDADDLVVEMPGFGKGGEARPPLHHRNPVAGLAEERSERLSDRAVADDPDVESAGRGGHPGAPIASCTWRRSVAAGHSTGIRSQCTPRSFDW